MISTMGSLECVVNFLNQLLSTIVVISFIDGNRGRVKKTYRFGAGLGKNQ